MRRSKSDPAKYARNYRSISQRRMTEHDAYNEEAEMKRLKEILVNSEAHLKNDREDNKRQREEPIKQERTAETSAYDQNEDDDLIVIPKKKKAKKQPRVELTPQEIRKAKLVHKNATRKLKQLTDRAEQKQKRAELYSKLKDTAISNEERDLLSSSSTLGKRETKREALKRLLQKERIGMSLTNEERDLLYSERGNEESHQLLNAPFECNDVQVQAVDEKQGSSKSKKKQNAEVIDRGDAHEHDGRDSSCDKGDAAEKIKMECSDANDEPTMNNNAVESRRPELPAAPVDLVAQMMASFTSLKSRTDEENKKAEEEPSMSELERIAQNEEKQKKVKVYVATNPVLVKTAASLGLKPNLEGLTSRRVLEIKRPADVEAKRFDLPVSSMEFEIMDAIRNNDVTILCSETGSGKSTQAPQFLYEAGFTLGSGERLIDWNHATTSCGSCIDSKACLLRNGPGRWSEYQREIKVGNLVAYQTRYETAGLGENTRIKFMTDGILLQEIQSDLLLRKYGVIILDEAHERNLNTDVLLGLLSVAIPLRRKASEEKGSNITPLKLVVMSATLRIEDFTENDKLFPSAKPAVIRVPGRTHPVTIHHSKVTELDDYERLAYKKYSRYTKTAEGRHSIISDWQARNHSDSEEVAEATQSQGD
ncbi:hypothetical protein MHU86_5926 [Fragilaria crotonensis]|nr:hypothetical protein MHU86_5926 [Fragilaria crotonensis]